MSKPETSSWFYEISYPSDNGWLPICGADDRGAAIPVVALAGRWDESDGTPTGGSHIDDAAALTLACRNGALGKCVDFGYRPWASATVCDWFRCVTTPLAAAHQTCTRAVRADYCGNGHSYTADGTPVDFFDALGVESSETMYNRAWANEAEWQPEGARCVGQARQPALWMTYSGRASDCFQSRLVIPCSDLFWHPGTVLISRARL